MLDECSGFQDTFSLSHSLAKRESVGLGKEAVWLHDMVEKVRSAPVTQRSKEYLPLTSGDWVPLLHQLRPQPSRWNCDSHEFWNQVVCAVGLCHLPPQPPHLASSLVSTESTQNLPDTFPFHKRQQRLQEHNSPTRSLCLILWIAEAVLGLDGSRARSRL
jgi:hypothetical protein